MKSKLLQKINNSDEENTEDPSEPVEATRVCNTRSTGLLTPKPLRKHSSQLGA